MKGSMLCLPYWSSVVSWPTAVSRVSIGPGPPVESNPTVAGSGSLSVGMSCLKDCEQVRVPGEHLHVQIEIECLVESWRKASEERAGARKPFKPHLSGEQRPCRQGSEHDRRDEERALPPAKALQPLEEGRGRI